MDLSGVKIDEDLLAPPDRLIGWVRGSREGPLLLCIGGVHGNEPAGVRGLEAVVTALEGRRDRMRGDFVAVAGNRPALESGQRFMAYDLNRAWTHDRVRAATSARRDGQPGSRNGSGPPEDVELNGLIGVLQWVRRIARGPVYVLDIHTTSADGGPFTTAADSLENRHFAMLIPAPLVLGLEELLDGTLLGYLNEFGYTTAGFECGQHEEPEAAKRAEMAVWLAMRGAGLLEPNDVPEAGHAYERLEEECALLPRVVEMRYRHAVADGDRYKTRPGYRNFESVTEGQVVGEDKNGAVVAPESGRLLMPLYQELGEDGFFVVREFSQAWLWISEKLRKAGVGRFVHWLPGVWRNPDIPGTLVADRRVARWFALELFHLLGYRRHLEEGQRLVVVQQRAERSDDGP